MSSQASSRLLLLIIIGVQQILNSPFDQTEFQLGSEEGSKTVEDFISSVNGFELMKHSPNSSLQPLEAVGKDKGEYDGDGGEETYKKKRKRRKRKRKLKSRNKNTIRVDQCVTMNINKHIPWA